MGDFSSSLTAWKDNIKIDHERKICLKYSSTVLEVITESSLKSTVYAVTVFRGIV